MLGIGSTAVSGSNPVPVSLTATAPSTFLTAGFIDASAGAIGALDVTVVTNGATPARLIQVMNSCVVPLRLRINATNSVILMPNAAIEVGIPVGATEVVAVTRASAVSAVTGFVVINLFS
jgi:hypothetical protein